MHPNLTSSINARLDDPQRMDDIDLRQLKAGAMVVMTTHHNEYVLRREPAGWLIRGNTQYCPDFTQAILHGSTWGTSMIKVGHLGIGLHLEFVPREGPYKGRTITTSAITKLQLLG